MKVGSHLFFIVYKYFCWENEMATHSSILAWRIPWTEDSGRLLSIGLQGVRYYWSNLAHMHVDVCVCVCVCVCVHVPSDARSWLTDCDPMNCSPKGFSIHGLFQARKPEWTTISLSSGSSWPRDRIHISCCISCIGRWNLYHCRF